MTCCIESVLRAKPNLLLYPQIGVDGCDKEQRTQIHKTIRHFYPKLSSTTTDGHKCIEVTKTGGGNRSSRSSWPQDRGDYCQCVLYKENIDTVDAVGVLARKLRQVME